MKFMEKAKRFFTLSANHDGFTLVELIVVIAILAILAGVAVPAYSGYIKKTNKGADQTTIRDVRQALELYAYSNPNSVSAIGVVLNQEGTAPVPKGNEAQVTEALAAVFGDASNIGLKYEDWKGESSALSYKESSYYGKESSLIGTVDGLTTALGKVIEDDANLGSALIGGNFKTFMEDYDVDTDNGKAVGNAAVLYVAQNTQGKEAEIKAAVYAGLGKGGGSLSEVSENIYNELVRTGIGDAAAMATVYAYTEGFVQHTGQAGKFNPDFSNVSGADAAYDALRTLGDSFDALDATGFDEYVKGGQLDKDLKGYIDMMGTINTNQDIVSGNLNANDCFTDGTVETMLKGHAAMADLAVTTVDGQVAVIVSVDADGMIRSHVTPMNWNK